MENLNLARGLYYSLFSKLFVFTNKEDRFDGIKEKLLLICQNPIDKSSLHAANRILHSFDQSNYEKVISEYDNIFHTPPRPLRTTISYFDEGREIGDACVKIKRILAQTDIRRDKDKFKESEDSFGFIFTLMGYMISQNIQNGGKFENLCEELFVNYINPFIDEFINSIMKHPKASIYKDIALIMSDFIEFERVYFVQSKPDTQKHKQVSNDLSKSEMIRREANKARRDKEKENERK